MLHNYNLFYKLTILVFALFKMRVAVADHISDTFLDTLVPLMLLVEAAQDGNQKEVEECAIVFTEGAAKLEEVGLIFKPPTIFIGHDYQ